MVQIMLNAEPNTPEETAGVTKKNRKQAERGSVSMLQRITSV